MPDLGIGEALAAFGGGDLLGGLFGGGAAAAGAGAADAGLAGIVGTGEGLFGGATGLEGTLASAGGLGVADAAAGAAGATALGTAADFLGAPLGASSGFGAAADAAAGTAANTGLASGLGDIAGTPSIASLTPTAMGGATALSPNVANANASMGGGSSVFDSGTSAVPGTNAAGGASAVPAGGGASAIAAPAGVTTPVDATAAGAAGAGANPAAAGSSSSISDLLSKAGSGAMKSLTSNPLGIALGAGGLGYNILEGQKNTKNQQALTADAQAATANSNQMVASGEALQQYLSSGQLPAGYQAQVDQAIGDAKTTAISNAAAQGLSTDPTQNTALAATLAKIDASKPAMQSQVASTLFSSGSALVGAGQSAAGLSGQLYQTLVQNDTAAAANTGKAIATLAAALNGKSSNTVGSTNISVSQG